MPPNTKSSKPSPWPKRLSSRLSALAPNASSESIATLVNWLSFNRKHSAALSAALLDAITNPETTAERAVLYLNVVHATLVADDNDASKRERMADFRGTLGEAVVVPAIEAVRRKGGDLAKLANWVDEWERVDVWEGPTILREVRRALEEDLDENHAAAAPASAAATADDPGEAAAATAAGAASGAESAEGEGGATEASKPAPRDERSNAKPKESEGTSEAGKAETASNVAAARSAEGGGSDAKDQSDEQKPADRSKGSEGKDRRDPMDASPSKGSEEKADDSGIGETETQMKEILEGSTNGTEEAKSATPASAASPATELSAAAAVEEKELDFESQGVEYRKVDVRDLIAPVKSIATMQIARELRNDTAVQLSSMLSTVPAEVLDVCREALEKNDSEAGAAGGKKQIDLSSIPDLPDDILDLDLDEALANVRAYRDIVSKQREARRMCIELLIRSRCKFGAEEAADAYYDMGDKAALLKKRKEMLSDAMALEGLDFEEENGDGTGGDDEELEDISWHDRSVKKDPEPKKAKVAS